VVGEGFRNWVLAASLTRNGRSTTGPNDCFGVSTFDSSRRETPGT